jgi:hypothetical protein
MRTLIPTHDTVSLVPADPTEVAIAGVRWRRMGWLQRLVRLDGDADQLTHTNQTPAEQASRRAA